MEDNPKSRRILPGTLILFVHHLVEKIVFVFIKLGFSPNALTIIALLLGLASGLFFALGHPIWAGIMLMLCGVFDILDGMVAVKTKRTSVFGAIFDSTLDRRSRNRMQGRDHAEGRTSRLRFLRRRRRTAFRRIRARHHCRFDSHSPCIERRGIPENFSCKKSGKAAPRDCLKSSSPA